MNIQNNVVLTSFMIFTFIMIIYPLYLFLSYLFEAIAFYKMSKRRNDRYPWIAWIPFANEYRRGKIAYNTKGGGIAMLICKIATVIFTILVYMGTKNDNAAIEVVTKFIYVISLILSIGATVFYYITTHIIYKKYSKKYVIMTILTILTLGALEPIFVFAIRNNEIKNIENN